VSEILEEASMGRAELWSELMKLTPAERVDLVQDLWDSIAQEDMPPLAEEEMDELERRLEEHRRDPSTAITWDELKAQLASRLK
jgi:putative addiction module component (TIGR02574 family)